MRFFQKIIFICFVNFTLVSQVSGKCRTFGIQVNLGVRLESQILTSSGVLLINAVGTSQNVLDSFNTKYPIYFFDSKSTVDVEIIEINKSQNSNTQALISSAKKLNVNATYALVIECLPPDESRIPEKWKVVKQEEVFGNTHFFVPVQVSSSTRDEIINPHNWLAAKFHMPIIGKRSCFIKAQIAGQNFLNPYIIPFDFKNKEVMISNSGCSGNFSIDPYVKYKVRFTLINSDGIQESHWTDWVEFEIG